MPLKNLANSTSAWLSPAIYLTTAILGILALIYPFLLPAFTSETPLGQARLEELPLMLTALLGLSLLVLVYEVQGGGVEPKLIALLGVLVAINATLRFIEVGIPGPGGFSPIFFLIILTGYTFGGRFGFLTGVLTILVSAILTGGVGPWLPIQMFAAGWVGMSAPLCRPLVSRIRGRIDPVDSKKFARAEIFVLAGFGLIWGLLYGIILNLWSWPFISGPSNQYWLQGISLAETMQRYASYYLVTSLVWDIARGLGTALIILGFGAAVLRSLRRFQSRFSFQYKPSQPDQPADSKIIQTVHSKPLRGNP